MFILKDIAKVLAASSVHDGLSGMNPISEDGIKAPCESPLYCYGPILHDIQRAKPFADSKTFVDMPAILPLERVETAYRSLKRPIENSTELHDFLSTYFAPAGQELSEVVPENMPIMATFLDDVEMDVNKKFVREVIRIWSKLTRIYNQSAICDNCDIHSSFIPIKRPFVIAGGRFREPYYWDSYWIIHGLLRSGHFFSNYSRNQIENFFDNIDEFGFVPNGARLYYLNRSQPPLLAQMVRTYLEFTGDTDILKRGLPLLIKEHAFFMNNRTVNVTIQERTYTLNRYDVDNNQPRPESYNEDWEQVNNQSYYASDGKIYPAPPLSQSEKHRQYRNLASGAESGWDFSSRFMSNPTASAHGDFFPLATYNIVNIVPVDLNAILYWNEITISEFLNMTNDETAAIEWEERARSRSEAMFEVMWNAEYSSYFDFNLSSNAQDTFWDRDGDAIPSETRPSSSPDQQLVFNVAQLTPFWTGAAHPSLKNSPREVRRAFARISDYLDTREGGIGATNLRTDQQWDQPNVWPIHMHMLMEALLKTPAIPGEDNEDWRWTQALALRLGQRYFDSAYCTWNATGGMFEKYSESSDENAGGGGEYEVVVGFGWSNGVLIWVADTFRDLATPKCGHVGRPEPNSPRWSTP